MSFPRKPPDPLTAPPSTDLTLRRFGRLVAIAAVGQRTYGDTRRVFWRCACDCGGEAISQHPNLVSGRTQSCGCLAVEAARRRVGAKSPAWKGGRWLSDGYAVVAMPVDHPFACMAVVGQRGWQLRVLEHRLVMAEHIGRPLRRHETVHHINGDRSDNRIENLQLRQGQHGSGQAMACGDCGSINVLPVELAS